MTRPSLTDRILQRVLGAFATLALATTGSVALAQEEPPPPPLPVDEQLSVERAEERLVNESKLIADPGERSRALERSARAFLISEDFDESIRALQMAGDSAALIRDPETRDTRLIATVDTALNVIEQLVQRGQPTASSPRELSLGINPLAALDRAFEPITLVLERAREVRSHKYSSDLLSRAAAILAQKSHDLAQRTQAVSGSWSYMGPPAPGVVEFEQGLGERADRLLLASERLATFIPMPVFRDRALIQAVEMAATSGQFERGHAIAQDMAHHASRAEALVELAEGEARAGLEQATATYQAALELVVRVPLQGPRRTASVILLESLMTVGRFEDARAIAYYVEEPQLRLAALSAVARTMGERGLADAAYRWIDTESRPDVRDRLRREVAVGLAQWVEERRIRLRSSALDEGDVS